MDEGIPITETNVHCLRSENDRLEGCPVSMTRLVVLAMILHHVVVALMTLCDDTIPPMVHLPATDHVLLSGTEEVATAAATEDVP
ncbi:hypothetical protein FRC07_009173, partial [Ceratobasidium sp. 392]